MCIIFSVDSLNCRQLNVCVEFGSKWDILFNPAKTQCVTFGGNSPKRFSLVIDDKQL